MKQARMESEERKERERRTRLMTNTKADSADYATTDVDLFGGPAFSVGDKYAEPITKGQQGFLYHQLGLKRKETKHMTKRQAGAIIGKTYRQAEADWCRLMAEAATVKELKAVGEQIDKRKSSDYLLRDEKLIASLRDEYKRRRGELA